MSELRRARAFIRAWEEYVEQHGVEHEEFCPEDDTCECALVEALNEAHSAWQRARQSEEPRIASAMVVIGRFGSIDGDHHKTWVLDQVVRALTGDGYAAWIAERNADPAYEPWDTGIAP